MWLLYINCIVQYSFKFAKSNRMILDNAIKIKNYKCFGEEPQGFEKIYPINIIIGKNNAGKSSLLDLVEFVSNGSDDFLKMARGNLDGEVFISTILKDEISCFSAGTRGGGIQYATHYDYGKTLLGSKVVYKLLRGRAKEIVDWEIPLIQEANSYKRQINDLIKVPLSSKKFKHITAEREIRPEANEGIIPISGGAVHLKPNGEAATRLVQFIINMKDQDSSIIEDVLLKGLNSIVNPEIDFKRILTQEDKSGIWEIYFEDKNKVRVALSKMGSGVKAILLVLLNLIAIPIVEKKRGVDYIFAFEELENNLHPALLRRLFAYIKNYSEEHKCYFFITTHSSIVIDFFGNDDSAQIIHITNDGVNAKCTTTSSFLHNKQILRDLDVRASDLLQSNGIVWVEGPSDRIYINKWLSLIAPELKEGIHFSIMFYGGKLLANLSLADGHMFEDELVPLLKINTNAFIVIDRDGDGTKPVNQTKQKRVDEIGADKFWITEGREIENYLTDRVINEWLAKVQNFQGVVKNEINAKLEVNISNVANSNGPKYNEHKKDYAIEIANYISHEDIDHLDLRQNMEALTKQIKLWNSMA